MLLGFVRRHPVWTWIFLVFLLTSVLVLVYLPRGIRWGLERWLERQGRISVEIEDVDFNPFSGRLVVHTLLAEREGGPGKLRSERAALNIEWWPLARKRLMLDRLTVQDAVVTVRRQGDTWYVGGLKIRTGEGKAGTKSAWRFGFDGIDLRRVKVVYLQGTIRKELLIEEGHLDAMQEWNPEQEGSFRLQVKAGGAPITLAGRARPFADQPTLEGRLEIAAFPLPWLEPWTAASGIAVRQGRLAAAFDLQTRLQPEEGRVRLSLDGRLSLDELQGSFAATQVEQGSARWRGKIDLAAPREGKPPLVRAEGTLSAAGLKVDLGSPRLRLSLEKLSLQERFVMGDAGVPAGAAFFLQVGGSAGPVLASSPENGLTLAALQRLKIDALRFAGRNRLSADGIDLSALRLLQRPDAGPQEIAHFLEIDRLQLENATADAGGARLGSARLRGIRGVVAIGPNGTLVLAPWSFAEGGGGSGGETPPKEKGAPALPPIRIGLLEIGGENRLQLIDGRFEPAVRVTVAPLQARIEQLTTAATAGDPPARFNLQLRADGHPLSLQGSARPAEGEVALEANLTLTEWPLAFFAPYLGPEVRVERGIFSADGRLKAFLGKGSRQLEATAKVQVPEFGAALNAPSLKVEGGQVEIEGEFALGTPRVPADAPFLLLAAGRIGRLRAVDAGKKLELFAASALKFQQLRLTGSAAMRVGALRLEALRLLERPGDPGEPSHLAAAGVAEATEVNLAGSSGLRLGELRLTGFQGILLRNRQGRFELAAWMPEGGKPAAGKGKEKAAKEPFRLQADRLLVSGESGLLFRDRSVDPEVRLELRPLRVEVKNLDTAATANTPIRIEGKFGRYTPLTIEAQARSFTPQPTLGLTARLSGFNLVEVTGYVETFVGYSIRSGGLGLQLAGKIVQGQANLEATLVLTQLDMEGLATEERQETERELGFPLETGLSLLRDKQGTITLNLPVSGDIRSPKVGIVGIVRSAVVKAMRQAAVGYFANLGATALGAPAGAAFLARRIFDRLTAVRFRPVAFPSGQAVLTDAARSYLREMAAKLEDRPGINVVLCGVVVPSDAAALSPETGEEALRQLAQRRSETVMAALAEAGIAPDRLVLCAPEVLAEEGDGPRVEVGI